MTMRYAKSGVIFILWMSLFCHNYLNCSELECLSVATAVVPELLQEVLPISSRVHAVVVIATAALLAGILAWSVYLLDRWVWFFLVVFVTILVNVPW